MIEALNLAALIIGIGLSAELTNSRLLVIATSLIAFGLTKHWSLI